MVCTAALAILATASGAGANAQSPRDANPERPTFATHAYAVAPGYAELEQGLAARGTGSLGEETSWDVNLKLGIERHVQAAIFGPLFQRNPRGHGVGDFGVALKLRSDLSARSAAAIVASVTAPTGSTARGLGTGRALGGLVGVFSADLPAQIHVDANAGPEGIGAGNPQWFASVCASRAFGAWGLAAEAFRFSAGGTGPRQAGVLAAVTLRPARWVVLDAGGVAPATPGTARQLFLGLTSNLGRVF